MKARLVVMQFGADRSAFEKPEPCTRAHRVRLASQQRRLLFDQSGIGCTIERKVDVTQFATQVMQKAGAFGALVEFDVLAMQDDRDVGLAGELIALHPGCK